jgi:hypothetical protein
MTTKWANSPVVRPCTITDHDGDELDVGNAGYCNNDEGCVAKLFVAGTSVHLTDPDRRALIVALGGIVTP